MCNAKSLCLKAGSPFPIIVDRTRNPGVMLVRHPCAVKNVRR